MLAKPQPSERDFSEEKTDWKAIIICALINFASYFVSVTLSVACWPYIKVLDPLVPVYLNGVNRAMMKLSHAFGTGFFSVHAYSSRRFRKTLIIGRLLLLAGLVLYLSIEIFPVSFRRYIFLIVFSLQSIADGSNIVFRSYIPLVSTMKDRQKAYSVMAASEIVAVISGPVIQLISAKLDERGIEVFFDTFRLNQFTVPLWIMLLIHYASLYIITFHFEDPDCTETQREREKSVFILEDLKGAFQQLKLLDFRLIVFCLLAKNMASIGNTVISTLMAPYLIATMNDSNYTAYLSIGTIITGVVSIIAVGILISTPLSKKVPSTVLFPFSLLCYFLLYAGLAIPWPGITQSVPVKSDENPYGCDQSELKWCDNIQVVHPWGFIGFDSLLFGVSLPIAAISFDTIYSKILGSVNQNIMQGIYKILNDLTMVGIPMGATALFSALGPTITWGITAGLIVLGFLLWIPVYIKVSKMKDEEDTNDSSEQKSDK